MQSHYSVLVRSMPDDYLNTVSQLGHHLTDDNIISILECENAFSANQKILDCLIGQIDTKEGLLDFCELLDSITNAPALVTVIREIKEGTYVIADTHICMCIHACNIKNEALNYVRTYQ